MASYGNRTKPALYKPTDFNSQQKKAQMRAEQKEIKGSSENPEASGIKGEKAESDSTVKRVTILKPPQAKEKESPTTTEKPAESPTEAKEKPEEKPGGVSSKDLDRIQKLREFMEKQQISEGKKTEEATKGKVEPAKTGKDVKPVDTNKAGKKDADKKTAANKTQKNSKAPPKGKGRQNERSPKKGPAVPGKKQEQSEQNQPLKEKSNTYQQKQTGAASSGTRPKHSTSKSDGATEKPKQQHNQRFNVDGSQNQKKTNSYYTNANYTRGFNEVPGQNMHHKHPQNQNASSILGNPYQHPPVPHTGAHHSVQQGAQHGALAAHPPQQQTQPTVPPRPGPEPGPSASIKSNKPHITVPASKDKNEHKRSLDFVKNFFNNDPEVQYHRKKNAEKVVSPSVPAPTPASSTVSNALSNSYVSTDTEIASYLSNHHIGSHGNQSQGNILPHNIPMPISNYSNLYHQSSMTPQHNPLHIGTSSSSFSHGHGATAAPLQQQQQQHRSSPGPFHTVGHGSIPQQHQQHQQQQQQRNYEMYSSMNQSALHATPQPAGPHFSMRSHATTHATNAPTNNYNLPSYSNYLPPGSHLGSHHVFHVQQELDQSAITSILDDPKKAKKWQKKALSKCGPIDSQQARSLIEQLIDGNYECMVCCDSIKFNNSVWSCTNCFHIFHLNCIRKWAKSEAASVKDQNGWRCPGCQNISTRPPNKYFCFCGKVRDPDWTPRDGITPHSCGEVCKKKRLNPPCDHSCNELCHPGPCPSCPVMVTKHCFCGKTSTKARCGLLSPITCENECTKPLGCGNHYCNMKCHDGPCKSCDVQLPQECFCSKEKRLVVCGSGEIVATTFEGIAQNDVKKVFSCKQACDRILSCGNHLCEDPCHLGDCKDCPLLPENVVYCPCKKVLIATLLKDEQRTSCLDPVPTCDSFCGRKLTCGSKGSSHICMMKCHSGPCKPCGKATSVQCRCGALKKDIPCKDLKEEDVLLCDRKCNKKRKCGRHKCNQKCCVDSEHNCNIICGKKLSCGTHKCDEVCHTGFCPTCWRAGFDELPCNCGTTVLFPPIACGTKPPECDQPCSRSHPCGHPPLHPCHTDETCPPCAVLTTKHCMGGHEVWKSVPCHLSDVACGKSCGKPMKCGMHQCIKPCHKGLCIAESELCTQNCIIPRLDCGHPCNAPCHASGQCPDTICKVQITVTCRCRRLNATAICNAGNVNSAYQSFNAEMLTMQLQNLQSGKSIDISGLTNPEKRPKFLECDEECSRMERNKRLADALGIDPNDDGSFQTGMYSASLKQEARLRLPFIQSLEAVFENLLHLTAKKSAQPVHHSFPPMNQTQRKIIHELAECYGFKTYSVDQEPKRSTVVVATKESYLPQVKLSVIAENEMKNVLPSTLNPNPAHVMPVSAAEKKTTLKSILKQPSGQSTGKRVNYFDDDFAE